MRGVKSLAADIVESFLPRRQDPAFQKVSIFLLPGKQVYALREWFIRKQGPKQKPPLFVVWHPFAVEVGPDGVPLSLAHDAAIRATSWGLSTACEKVKT
jgi:hypothetical protein